MISPNSICADNFADVRFLQYPVFPWVIAQYTKDTIDLTEPSTFRDLSKPIGALNEGRLKDFMERYNSLGESDVPPFMYGSHYSTMVGVVLHFLVRLQPFASLHQDIQNGYVSYHAMSVIMLFIDMFYYYYSTSILLLPTKPNHTTTTHHIF